ncbi:MAG: 16S rRNA (cytidine(1402)-2'-O)-methyltransferase [Nitrospirae bacterium]|nr:16S rRNA (cytidine(1402)-2'-O)-methyltransferase [Nitrospirota bacterium]
MKTGILYIVSTPIGNLEDITLRALNVLKSVQVVASEDTRHTQVLLQHYNIYTPQTSYHDHNKEEKGEVLIGRLKEGNDIALVSDAGTPGISDPGYYLINRAIEEEITISPIPGPTASIAALSISGLPTDSFAFEGFLPVKRVARQKKLRTLLTEHRTIIIYEAPHRLLSTLEDIKEISGDRRIAITRELTKVFEEIIRGRVSEIIARISNRKLKGEITIILEGAKIEGAGDGINLQDYLKILIEEKGMSLKDAVSKASADLDIPRNKVYKEAILLVSGSNVR